MVGTRGPAGRGLHTQGTGLLANSLNSTDWSLPLCWLMSHGAHTFKFNVVKMSAPVHLMSWYHLATNGYLTLRWQRSMTACVVPTGPQWVNRVRPGDACVLHGFSYLLVAWSAPRHLLNHILSETNIIWVKISKFYFKQTFEPLFCIELLSDLWLWSPVTVCHCLHPCWLMTCQTCPAAN